MTDNLEYIGDSVYVDFDGMAIRIYTNNGLLDENVIYLEPREAEKLVAYIKRQHEAFADKAI